MPNDYSVTLIHNDIPYKLELNNNECKKIDIDDKNLYIRITHNIDSIEQYNIRLFYGNEAMKETLCNTPFDFPVSYSNQYPDYPMTEMFGKNLDTDYEIRFVGKNFTFNVSEPKPKLNVNWFIGYITGSVLLVLIILCTCYVIARQLRRYKTRERATNVNPHRTLRDADVDISRHVPATRAEI